MKFLIWSKSKERRSRRKMLALAKLVAGPLSALLITKFGIEVEEQGLGDALGWLFVILGGWIGWDAVRDWRNRNSEDDSQSLRGRR